MSATWQPGEQQGGQQAAPQAQSAWQPAPQAQPAWQPAPAWAPQAGAPTPSVPQHAPQGAAWSSPTHPGPRTDLLALLAILAAVAGVTVLPVLGSVGALVLGPMGLARIRRSGDDGRLLAVWGIVLGAATLVATIAMVVIAVTSFASAIESFAPSFAP